MVDKLLDLTDRSGDRWTQMGTSNRPSPIRYKKESFDLVVMGGGMAGICAAVSAARNGT